MNSGFESQATHMITYDRNGYPINVGDKVNLASATWTVVKVGRSEVVLSCVRSKRIVNSDEIAVLRGRDKDV